MNLNFLSSKINPKVRQGKLVRKSTTSSNTCTQTTSIKSPLDLITTNSRRNSIAWPTRTDSDQLDIREEMDYDRNAYRRGGGGRTGGGGEGGQSLESRGRESYYGSGGGGGGGGRQDQQYQPQQQPSSSRDYSPASQRAPSPFAQSQPQYQPQGAQPLYSNSASGSRTHSASEHQVRPSSVVGAPGQQGGGGASGYTNERTGQQLQRQQQYDPTSSVGGHSARGSGAPFTQQQPQQRNSGTSPPSFNRTSSSDPQNGYRQNEGGGGGGGGWNGPGPDSSNNTRTHTPPSFAQRQSLQPQSPSRDSRSLLAASNGQTGRNVAPTTTTNGLGPPVATIGPNNEPLHDLARAVGLLKSTKFYAEGFVMKRTEVGADGKMHPGSLDSQWSKWFVQLSGTIMSTWNANEMEEAAREGRTVPPQYLNLSDAFLHPFPPSPRGIPSPTPFQFSLNSAGLNRILFCAPSEQSLQMWINAIRLAAWEKGRCNEIYTGALLGLRENKSGGWGGGGEKEKESRLEGWLKARLPGDTEWRQVYTVVHKSTIPILAPSSGSILSTTKKSRRSSLLNFGRKNQDKSTSEEQVGGGGPTGAISMIEDLPGKGALATIAFYANKVPVGGKGKKGVEQPLCIVQHLFYASALYPEASQLIDVSTLFKIEGTFLNPADGFKSGWGVGGRAEKQGYALLMLDEAGGSVSPGADGMLKWIVGLSDAFKLYGRPKALSFDPRDPSSLYFALPLGPHRERQFLDRELVDHLDVNESRPRAIRAVFHNILFDRMRGLSRAPGAAVVPSSNQNSANQEQQRMTSPNSLNPIGEDSENNYPAQAPREPPPSLPTIEASPATDYLGVEAPLEGMSPRSDFIVDSPTALNNQHSRFTSEVTRQDDSSTPPPPTQAFRTSTFSPPLVPMENSQSVDSFSSLARPTPQSRATDDSAITHLTYAAPSGSGSGSNMMEMDRNQVFVPPPQSTVYTAPTRMRDEGEERGKNFLGVSNPDLAQDSYPEQGAAGTYGMERRDEDIGVGALAGVATVGAVMETNKSRSATSEVSQDPNGPHAGKIVDSPDALPHQELHDAGNFSTKSLQFSPTIPQESDQTLSPKPLLALVQTSLPAGTTTVSKSAQAPPKRSFDLPEEYNIHSDLLAALDYVDRSETPSPHPASIQTSPEPSPVVSRAPTHFGPPSRRIARPPSPVDEEYVSMPPAVAQQQSISRGQDQTSLPPPLPGSVSSKAAEPTSFPSTFAKNKKAEERVAAAQVAQEAQQVASNRPGRSGVKGKGKQRVWQDSDEEEEEVEESDDEEELQNGGLSELPIAAAVPRMSMQGQNQTQGQYYASPQGRQSYYDNGPESRVQPDPAPSSGNSDESNTRKPFVSPHGLLHAGILDKEERSARAQENQARDTGGPLVSIPSKPPPPQTGLVGAITSHQRDKERTGGVGRALTEQQRERKLAEQRQKQLDDNQKAQLFQQQQMMMQQQQQQQFGGYNPMMMNPWMMGGGGYPGMGYMGGNGMGSPMGGPMSPGGAPPRVASPSGQSQNGHDQQGGGMDAAMMHHQQQQQQQAQHAMMVAQQAYMQAMAQFQQPPPSSGSPSLGGMPSYPSMNFGYPQQFGGPSPYPQSQMGGFNPYGQQQQMFNPQQPPVGHNDKTHAEEEDGYKGEEEPRDERSAP